MRSERNTIEPDPGSLNEFKSNERLPEKPESQTLPEVQRDTLSKEKLLDNIVLYISRSYVRKDGRYYATSDSSEKYSLEDVKRSLAVSLPELFRSEHLSGELIEQAVKRAITQKHNDPMRTVPVWNGRVVCKPGNHSPIVREGGFVSINSWIWPAYRSLTVSKGSTAVLDQFLNRTMSNEQDCFWVKNWLAWCLKNEARKPGWAIFLYSKNKGTGKSTLLELMSKLFGELNTANCTTLDSVVGRFNSSVFANKFITVEEVKLQQGSKAANSMKTFITEPTMMAERKGVDARAIEQCAAFALSSNHLPSWIEEGERRYMVIEMDHAGHAQGAEREQFVRYIKIVKEHLINNPQRLAVLYKGLMKHDIPEDFNPFSLPFERIDTPVMRRIQSGSSEVQQDRLEELLKAREITAIPEEELCSIASEELKIQVNRLKHMMFDLGWDRVKKKWGGKVYTRNIWLAPGYSMHRGKVTDSRGDVAKISYRTGMTEEDLDEIESIGGGVNVGSNGSSDY